MSDPIGIFVAGGTGGIGRAIVADLAAAGHRVAFTSRSPDGPGAELACATGATIFAMDQTDPSSVEAVVDQALATFGQIDAVVLTAALHKPGLAVGLDLADWRAVMEVGLTGAFLVSRQFLLPFLGQGGGRFLFLGSTAARGMTGGVAYASAKAGLIGLSGTLAREYGRKGITSNVLELGLIDTGMGEAAAPRLTEFWARACPAGRVGQAADAVAAVRFLISPEAAFINGAVIRADGGLDWVP